MYFGPDQHNYLKIEIEHRTDTPGVFITLFKEEKGVTATIGQVAVPNPASVSTLDFQITGDMETGTLTAGYRINSTRRLHRPRHHLHTCEHLPVVLPAGPSRRPRVPYGSTTAITGVYDWFRVL